MGDEAIPLVFVGRLSPEKRPSGGDRATANPSRRGPNVTLRVVGDGPLRGQLEAQAIGLPVRFVGHLDDRRSIATIVAGARVMLAPCGTETFGLAVLEATACGTPVLVPPDGGAKELLAPGTGAVVEPDAKAIAAATLALLDGDIAEQRRHCRSHAEQFTWDAAAAAMLDVFVDVVSRRSREIESAGEPRTLRTKSRTERVSGEKTALWSALC